MKTWHLHAHCLVDATYALPTSDWKFLVAGRWMRAFDYIKHVIEFDWTRLWVGGREHWMFGARPRKNARPELMAEELFHFESWLRERYAHETMEYSYSQKRKVPITSLSASEMSRRREWNRKNRRVVDIRPVTDRDGAAKEVLKYITKCAEFSDLRECVEEFHDATKGARMIQTFGSWYGVKLDVAPDHEDPEDWGELKCACGQNWFVRNGLYHRYDVHMDADGRWRLRRQFGTGSAGTVARPTIRALDERVIPEDFNYGYEHNSAA
jgi:hypothetical protein